MNQEKKNPHFFQQQVCPACGRKIPYHRLLARLPLFQVTCSCGERISFSAGKRTWILWGITLLFCCLSNFWMMKQVHWILPLLCYTVLIVAAAFFLSPFVWDQQKKKNKK